MQRETIQRLATAVQRFFKDKHDCDIVNVVGADPFRSALGQSVQNVYGRPESNKAEEAELHRAVMAETIRALRTLVMEDRSLHEVASAPQVISRTESPDPEQAFFDRLQALEAERRWVRDAAASAAGTSTTTNLQSAVGFEDDVQGLQGLAQPHAPSKMTTILPQQSLAPRGRIVPVLSMKRAWTYQCDRAIITWSGPLPSMSDASHVAIAAVLMPSSLSCHYAHTPFVIMRVTGVGDAITECIMVRGVDSAWGATFNPVHKHVRFIKPVPTPWTIEVLDWTGHRLDLGKDGFLWKDVAKHAWPTDILVTGSGQHTTSTIAASKKLQIADDTPVLNESRQWVVLLELAA